MQTCLAVNLDGNHVLTSAECCTITDPTVPLGDLTMGSIWMEGTTEMPCEENVQIMYSDAYIEGPFCIINHKKDIFNTATGHCIDARSAPCLK